LCHHTGGSVRLRPRLLDLPVKPAFELFTQLEHLFVQLICKVRAEPAGVTRQLALEFRPQLLDLLRQFALELPAQLRGELCQVTFELPAQLSTELRQVTLELPPQLSTELRQVTLELPAQLGGKLCQVALECLAYGPYLVTEFEQQVPRFGGLRHAPLQCEAGAVPALAAPFRG